MRIETDEKGNIILKEVYNGITLESNNKETLSVCMRDSGFEFTYEGEKYSAQDGVLTSLNNWTSNDEDKTVDTCYLCFMKSAYIKMCYWDGNQWLDMWKKTLDGDVKYFMNLPPSP